MSFHVQGSDAAQSDSDLIRELVSRDSDIQDMKSLTIGLRPQCLPQKQLAACYVSRLYRTDAGVPDRRRMECLAEPNYDAAMQEAMKDPQVEIPDGNYDFLLTSARPVLGGNIQAFGSYYMLNRSSSS